MASAWGASFGAAWGIVWGPIGTQPAKKPDYVVGGVSWQQKRDAELLSYDDEALMMALIAQHQEILTCLHI